MSDTITLFSPEIEASFMVYACYNTDMKKFERYCIRFAEYTNHLVEMCFGNDLNRKFTLIKTEESVISHATICPLSELRNCLFNFAANELKSFSADDEVGAHVAISCEAYLTYDDMHDALVITLKRIGWKTGASTLEIMPNVDVEFHKGYNIFQANDAGLKPYIATKGGAE